MNLGVQIDKKYLWFGLGAIVVILTTFLVVNQATDTKNLTGNILGTPEEYSTLTASIDAKISNIETDISELEGLVATPENQSTLSTIQTSFARTESAYNDLNAAGAPTDEATLLSTNTTLNEMLSSLESLETQLNTLRTALGAPSGGALICPYEESSSAEFEQAENFKTLYDSVRNALNGLSDKSQYSDDDKALMDVVIEDLTVLVNDYETEADCFALANPADLTASIDRFKSASVTDKVSLMNLAIDSFNEGPAVCARAKTCSDIRDLTNLDEPLVCAAGTTYNPTTDRCEAPVVTCQYTDVYPRFDALYNLLVPYTANPASFDSSVDQSFFAALTNAISTLSPARQTLFDSFLVSFDYSTQANALVNTLNTVKQSFNTDNNQCSYVPYSNLSIVATQTPPANSTPPTNTTPPANNTPPTNNNTDTTTATNNNSTTTVETPSCPIGSTYDSGLQGCYCDASLDFVEPSGSCSEQESGDGDAGEEPIICEDGTVVEDLLMCTSSEDGASESGGSSTETDGEGLYGSGEDDSGLSLTTNTNANVMMSNVVQGETGLAIFTALLALFLVVINVIIWAR